MKSVCPPVQTPDKVKRVRLQRKGPQVPLHTELGGYTQQQLVAVIDKLVALHPQLEEVRPTAEREKQTLCSYVSTILWHSEERYNEVGVYRTVP